MELSFNEPGNAVEEAGVGRRKCRRLSSGHTKGKMSIKPSNRSVK